MAGGGSVHNFRIALSDVDRGVYAELNVNAARHPSETVPFLATRALAYALEYDEGIAFSGGLCNPDEPALWVRDLTGALVAWIDLGTPSVDRVHRASKAADRVVIYPHRDATAWTREIAGARVHAPDRVQIVTFDLGFLAALADTVDRRTAWSLTVTEGVLYAEAGGLSLTSPIHRRRWIDAS